MNNRPEIKLALTATDRGFEILGWVSILAICVLTITNYTNLPETIPVHDNGAGQADGFGGKGNILTLPLIATRMIRYLKLLIVIIFGLIVLQTNGQTTGPGVWFYH